MVSKYKLLRWSFRGSGAQTKAYKQTLICSETSFCSLKSVLKRQRTSVSHKMKELTLSEAFMSGKQRLNGPGWSSDSSEREKNTKERSRST